MSTPTDFKPDPETESLVNQIRELGIRTSVATGKYYNNLLLILDDVQKQRIEYKSSALSKIRDEILAYRLAALTNRGVLDIAAIEKHENRDNLVELLNISQETFYNYKAFVSRLCDALLLEESIGSERCFSRVRDIILGGF